jgi:hypothetical protein
MYMVLQERVHVMKLSENYRIFELLTLTNASDSW